MTAAAKHLTPVILELGGKSPVIIDKNCNLKTAVPRIVWGKFTNAGQTCIAPDYILVHKSRHDEFISLCKEAIENFYGGKPDQSADYARIINVNHTNRLAKLMQGGKVACGGEVRPDDRYIAPTLLTGVDVDSQLMQDEIFGPLLPILPYEDVDFAINFVNDRPKPLALYVFTSDNSFADRVLAETHSGGGAVNECLLHNICKKLPFGGVGESGMGAYNGKITFDSFTHRKGFLLRSLGGDLSLRFPPFTETKLSRLELITSIPKKLPSRRTLLFMLGVAVISLVYYFRPF